ncbi:hypothetical protein ES288_D06G247500v1 [Gossypium darwinii]|uniref:Uncharacterized protein n=1 Tax=Gossypium darwinii TaxID=34276 RepID=A0A5D2C9E5_GOSDA|nr:hypothetical protein ES288_D06G247500v1 [Gossypium darwinii]
MVHTGRKTCISCVEAITASIHARSGPMSAALLIQGRLFLLQEEGRTPFPSSISSSSRPSPIQLRLRQRKRGRQCFAMVHTGRKACISCVEAITASTHGRSGPKSAGLLMQGRLGFFFSHVLLRATL